MGAAHARSHAQRNRGNILNVNGVNIEYQYDGAHDARPTEHTLHGLDGLNLSGLDWMRLSHVCRLMAARDRKPKRAFVRVSGWTADRPNMRLIVDVLQDDDGTVSVPLPLISDYLLVNSGECDGRLFQYGWLDVLVQLPEHVDYGRLDETGMRVVDWLNGMADPSPEIFEDWEAISLIRQNVYEDEPTGLADLLRSATRTERDECFDMLEQVARQAGLEALSCPTIPDSKYMPGQGRYECEYVDAKGKAHDLSLLVASGDRVWLYDHNGKPMKVTTK